MKLSTVFSWAFAASVVPGFLIARYGENHWGFDSIGTWYTVLCGAFFAVVFAVVVAFLAVTTGVIRAGESKRFRNGDTTDA